MKYTTCRFKLEKKQGIIVDENNPNLTNFMSKWWLKYISSTLLILRTALFKDVPKAP